MTQTVERLTFAQVMISQLVGLSPTLGSVLTARSLEPVLDSVCPSLSTPPPLACTHSLSLSLSLSLSKINLKKEKNIVFFNFNLKCAHWLTKFSVLCVCSQMTTKVPQTLIWGLQVDFSE